MDCMQNLRLEFVERALLEMANLKSGTCLIMKGSHLMNKRAYLRSWKREIEFTLNYNLAKAAMRLNVRGPQKPSAGWRDAVDGGHAEN